MCRELRHMTGWEPVETGCWFTGGCGVTATAGPCGSSGARVGSGDGVGRGVGVGNGAILISPLAGAIVCVGVAAIFDFPIEVGRSSSHATTSKPATTTTNKRFILPPRLQTCLENRLLFPGHLSMKESILCKKACSPGRAMVRGSGVWSGGATA